MGLSYLDKVQALAKAASTSPQEIADFLRGSTVKEVQYDKDTDTLMIMFYNERKDESVRTYTERVSDIVKEGAWVADGTSERATASARCKASRSSFLAKVGAKGRRYG